MASTAGLAPGCCYGPDVIAPDNGGTASTWNIAGAGDLVNMLTHNFAPGTSEQTALGAVVSGDLPHDARQRSWTAQDVCVVYQFSSAEMAAAARELGGTVTITMYSGLDLVTGDQKPLDTGSVTDVKESIAGGAEC